MPDGQAVTTWKPIPSGGFLSFCGRITSCWSYPAMLPYAVFFHGPANGANVENARFWRNTFSVMLLAGGIAGHGWVWRKWGLNPTSKHPLWSQALLHSLIVLMWDIPYLGLSSVSHELIEIFSVNRKENRLNAGNLHGPRVLVVGNGPSACQGDQFGDEIDKFDEVVRFNNFQTKVAGLEKWVGTKCTVHFSDGVLYPTYSEYHVPGATVILSLFVDRYFVAGSYCIMRAGADLAWHVTYPFLKDPSTTWIDKERIDQLKKALGLKGAKHPTSGMLAIDYFINKPGVQLPVIIHGFDFFMGPTMHYYHDQEPLWERMNNYIGVNMHSPHLEKIYVEKLIAEGKVKFLKDMPRTS